MIYVYVEAGGHTEHGSKTNHTVQLGNTRQQTKHCVGLKRKCRSYSPESFCIAMDVSVQHAGCVSGRCSCKRKGKVRAASA